MGERPTLGKRPSSHGKEVSPPPSKRRQQSTTTSKAIANFFTPLSKKEPEKMVWRVVKDSLLVGRYGTTTATRAASLSKRRIAAFDFDSTLITPASGKTFGRDANDWKWWHSSVPGRLKSLHQDGYLIAIISNQGGINLRPDPKTIKSNQKRLGDFKTKVSSIFNQLDLPITLYAATSRDQYRKPRTGVWQEILEDFDLDSVNSLDLEQSVFVGDAGGREAVTGGAGKDHSCVDRDFAANIGLPFHTPEEFFLNEEPRSFVRSFNPVHYLQERAERPTNTIKFSKADRIELVLFCGSPGAGKSSFYWRHLQPLDYGRVNQDILKTREKCVRAATALLEERISVVVDNTNADPETRAVWINLAQKLGVPIRCVLFTAPVQVCQHNDTFRALNIGQEANPEKRTILPHAAFSGFASRYCEPKISEGFEDIIMTGFEFEGSDEQKSLWSQYWI
ncbi:PNK3P-domain-containing protein [Plenodomus tracheiphilus IPT5]|uniref:PNK3P-domain-containing protein n=1 Tax=Plenodomus tracheiphilus IPT5 TaxID=1408161 RepID=A0A6A7B0Y8_9PLEO|nr:PNK3P-domain-containing protein [Plenodomus tracheiphilus IPT5]